MSKRVGIREVAAAAGVSVTTVSHSLSGGGQLSDATRKRVRSVAESLNYTPNRLASGLRSKRSQIIGFVSDEISTTPYAGNMLLGAQDAAAAHDQVLMVVNSNRNAQLEARGIDALLQHRVDGIIYARMYHQAVELPAALSGVPTVFLDASNESSDLSSVVPDEEGAALTAMDHLIEAGHRRIGYLNNIDDIPATRGRLAGYRAALAKHGIPFDESLIALSESMTGPGRDAASRLLARPDRPTALFCFNDRIAMGAYQAAHLARLAIPHDLSIVSIDNFEVLADALLPGLTSIALPHYEMGRWAAERLAAELAGEADSPPEQIRMHCPLVLRQSVGPPLR
ncbi:LacI family DNA-binding transcriptional regulator [Cryobacterium levicorallinum]|uniref:LacI family DNA-binding transcriptional regulator n=1 Tax=Cryobacterium levicorallinum TaxID=995038 RepID=A0A1I3DJ80_9MICO|nr:LacI family DNA-binding transcriptional regulator [Cryobacterium levicorallinum]TFB84692.1 LacI family DNA-binding transcriptional regulator [Cryobacterium levicorallinum]GEP28769.1 alanine racemase [Cryobacterium levicorallinum]SFH86551.1 transcriptional regulator, LacI family [Cryobacterium levicorallinum]